MSDTHKRVGNAIAWVDLEPSNSQSESVGIAIVSYLQNLPECPDDSPTDDERGGWKVWALDRADEVIEAMGKAAIEEWYRGANRRGEPIEPVSDRLRTILNEVDPHSTCEEAADLLDEQAARIAELEAEVERRDLMRGTDGCSTGDCPHDTMSECLAAQGEIIREQNAKMELIWHAAGDEDPVVLIEAAKKLPRDALGGIVTLDSPLWGWVPRYDGTPGEVHQQNWMRANRKEIAKCYPTIEQAREAAEAAKGVSDVCRNQG